MYRHDYAGTGASPLSEINAGNVAKLTRVWSYALQGEAGPPPNSEATPIVVNGVMYLPATGRVVALDPEKGTEIWRYAVTGGQPSRRGVAYWPGDGALPSPGQ
jgi:quinoprotein glucose dehydrogenase